MTQTNKSALQTPVIGKVTDLIQYIFRARTLPCKDLQHIEVETIRKQCDILFEQAMNEIHGRDYLKRATETIHSIQARAYLIYNLHGWSIRVAATIDAKCQEIAEQLYRVHSANGQSHQVQGQR